MSGLLNDFQECIGFVAETKRYWIGPNMEEIQEEKFSSHSDELRLFMLLLTDVYGGIVRLYTVRPPYDHGLYIASDVHRYPSHFLSKGETGTSG